MTDDAVMLRLMTACRDAAGEILRMGARIGREAKKDFPHAAKGCLEPEDFMAADAIMQARMLGILCELNGLPRVQPADLAAIDGGESE